MSPAGPPAGLSASNPGVQQLRRLARRRSARAESGTYLVDGPVLLSEALAAGVILDGVFVEPAGAADPAVLSARAAGVPVHQVQEGALSKVLDVVAPRHVVAVARSTRIGPEEVLRRSGTLRRPVAVLAALQDPGNAGTLVRVAEASGCVGVIMTEGTVDLHNPKTVRATAGAVFRTAVSEGVANSDLVDLCRNAGVATWALVGAGGTPLHQADLTEAAAFVVGSESHGVAEDLVGACDGRLTIPMEGGVESLNAGVAGAIVLFEAARQRGRSLGGGTASGAAGPQ